MLDRDLRMNRRLRKPRAVVVDLDETILDNGLYEGMQVKNHVNFNQKDFTDWINRAEATAVPGSVEFLNYAAAHGVTVFYITNRRETQKLGTVTNLKKLGFPNVNDQTLLIQTDPNNSSKEPTARILTGTESVSNSRSHCFTARIYSDIQLSSQSP